MKSISNAILNALVRREIGNASQRKRFLKSSPRAALSRDAKKVLDDCDRLGLSILFYLGEDYPPAFLHVPDPPLILFVAGYAGSMWNNAVAIVGGREATGAGKRFTARIAQELSEVELTVVSGLARGIDTAAHEGALKGKTATVAVLGGGHGHMYPKENAGLANRISEAEGAVVSEYPPDWPPTKLTFPERNRIISGLSHGVLVIEAREKSGSLITASYALEQGKEVMAVPGPVESQLSRGGHQLIREGAGLVETVEDVFNYLGLHPDDYLEVVEEGDLRGVLKQVFDALDHTETSMDRLVERTGLSAQDLMMALMDLEMREFVEQRPSGYIRAATK